MPSYQHLLTEKLNFSEISKRVQTASLLGAPYTKAELEDAEKLARKQSEVIAAEIIAQGGPVSYKNVLVKDSTVIALIAYLQRIGTDLNRVEPPPKDDSQTPPGVVDAVPSSVPPTKEGQ